MTWSQFFNSMARGLSNRTATASRRAAKPTNRAASTQAAAKAVKPESAVKKPPMETWDRYLIDVSMYVSCVQCDHHRRLF